MIGSGNPKEGDMRPQMLDRFGLSVNLSTLRDVDSCIQLVLNRMSYDTDPLTYIANAAQETDLLRKKLVDARLRLEKVKMPTDIKLKISTLCARLEVDGLRGDLVTNRAAKARAAIEGRTTVTMDDVERVISICLGHRLRKDPYHNGRECTGCIDVDSYQ